VRAARPAFVVMFAVVVACAHLEGTERLTQAKDAYAKAEKGPAAQYSPAELATAKKFLDQANDSLKTGNAKIVDQKATIALLKIQWAEAIAGTHLADAERDAALKQLNLTREQMLETASQQLNQTQQQLERERQARNDAEQKLAQSRQELEQYAQVQDVARGTVITLSGGVLFESGRAELMAGAEDRLARVAAFLKNSKRNVIVEGYTDSSGSPSTNLELSALRAQVVRGYLVQQGVPLDRIRSEGKGSSSPVASNATSSGRSLNRRVQIVLEPPRPGSAMSEGAAGVGGSTGSVGASPEPSRSPAPSPSTTPTPVGGR
jgi:outer membrane protein OmpA-like peptidoglycan-associated protein